MEHPEISQLEMEITWEEFENFLSLKKELEKLESENAKLKEQNFKLRSQIKKETNFSCS